MRRSRPSWLPRLRPSPGFPTLSIGKVPSICSASWRTEPWQLSTGSQRMHMSAHPSRTRCMSHSMAAVPDHPFRDSTSAAGRVGPRCHGGDEAFVPFNEFHAHTKRDWLEGLAAGLCRQWLRADFYREVAAFVDPDTRALVRQVLADEGHADFVIEGARSHRRRSTGSRSVGAVGASPCWRGTGQAQRVAADRDA